MRNSLVVISAISGSQWNSPQFQGKEEARWRHIAEMKFDTNAKQSFEWKIVCICINFSPSRLQNLKARRAIIKNVCNMSATSLVYSKQWKSAFFSPGY
jgi:hypothetical protein